MSLSTGSQLGRYEILGLLGSGGMGEVYHARDTHLHRDVALKILPEAAAGNNAAEARFEREARAIASVSHPNICAVYDVGVDSGRRFLVMERLEGETLQQRLLRGAFDIPTLLEHAIALADALHAAHARDVIHRDLKPANIFLTSRGELKILDFGLAKATDSSDGPTRAADDVITGKGTAVGTAAYMSPEQIRGESLDARTDLFSLGLVLYEMGTGQRAFSGSTGAAVAASILNQEAPRPGEVRAGLPSEIDRAILKTLEKDRDLRYQTAADLRADLKRVKRELSAQASPGSDGAPVRTSPSVWDGTGARQSGPSADHSSSSDTQLLGAILSRHRVWAGAAAAAIVLALAAATWLRPDARESSAASTAFSNLQVQPLTMDGMAQLGAISPDGRFLVYQRVGQGVRVRQTSGEIDVDLVEPGRFSRISSLTVTPDNNFVDIVATTGTAPGPVAWRVPILGGNPRELLRHVVSAIGWSPDGRTMAFVRSEAGSNEMAVVLADADGSNQRDLITRRAPKMFYGDLTARLGRPPSGPAWSPDGELLVLTGYSSDTFGESSDLVVLDARTGAEHRTVPMRGNWSEVAWLHNNRVLFAGGPEGRDVSRLWVSDLAGRHLTPITREFGFFMNLSLTEDRTTAVAKRFTRSSGIWVSDASGGQAEIIVPVSPAGAAHPSLDAAGGLTYRAVKADGTAAVYHLARGTSTPFQVVDRTTPPIAARHYDVSSDGRTIIYTDYALPHGLFRVQNNGSERVRLVQSDTREPRLTPDGHTVLFTMSTPGLYSVPTAGGAVTQVTDRVIGRGSGASSAFSVSPDGTRVLLSTDKPGVVAMCSLPACRDWTELPLPSVDWTPDGAGVAYVQDGTTIMKRPLDGAAPRPLARLEGSEPIMNFRWSPDGSRLATSRGWYRNDMIIIRGLR